MACWSNFKNGIGKRGGELRQKWETLFADYGKKYPDLANQISRMQQRELPDGWDKNLPTFPADAKGMATRESSGKVLNVVAESVPWLVGGSADLAGSDRTRLKFEGAGDFQAGSYGGRNLHFGVREHGMAAALNGMAVSQDPAFRRHLLQFQRLHAALGQAGRPDGDSHHLCLDPRFHRPRRGRSHAPADRTTGVAAGDAGTDADTSRRCQRSGRGMEGHHAAAA